MKHIAVIFSILFACNTYSNEVTSPLTDDNSSATESFPLRYGISAVHSYVKDRTKLSNFRPENGGDLPAGSSASVTFDRSESRTEVYNLRGDMWVLPFLNFYMVGGYMEGESSTLINFSNPFTGQSATLVSDEAYYGTNVGGGINLVYGIDQWVFSLDLNYTQTNLNVVDSKIKSITVGPRLGYRMRLGNVPCSFSIGRIYQNIQQTLTITEESAGAEETFVAKLDIEGEKPWNTVLSGVIDLGRHWQILTEIGFDDRESLVAQLTYRFE